MLNFNDAEMQIPQEQKHIKTKSYINYYEELQNAVLVEYGTAKTKIENQIISNLTCPVCGDRTAWCYANKPNSVNCNRLNNCGIKTPTGNLIRDRFLNIEVDYHSTADDLLKPARSYFQSRNILEIEPYFELVYLQQDKDKRLKALKTGAAGVYVHDGENKIFTGRLLNGGGSHTVGSWAGVLGKSARFKYDKKKPLFICEGLPDCLSFFNMGLQVVFVFSAGQTFKKLKGEYQEFILSFNKQILCFDGDTAGVECSKKWIKELRKVKNDN
jgi:hypothetical protein